jgi:UDP-N-acetylmuramoyl-L-alanyl-D-glutamate--2,6-diaminopimelate ligase
LGKTNWNFNAYNALAYGTAVELGMDSLETLRLLSELKAFVDSNTLFRVLILRRLLIMLILLTHLENVLKTTNDIRLKRTINYGCGLRGNRDRQATNYGSIALN